MTPTIFLPEARELLAANPAVDAGALAVLPLLFALLFLHWFVRGGVDRTLHVR